MFRNVVCSEYYFIRVVPRVRGYVGVLAVESIEEVSERSREAVYDSERFVVVVARCYDAVSERFVIIHNFCEALIVIAEEAGYLTMDVSQEFLKRCVNFLLILSFQGVGPGFS